MTKEQKLRKRKQGNEMISGKSKKNGEMGKEEKEEYMKKITGHGKDEGKERSKK